MLALIFPLIEIAIRFEIKLNEDHKCRAGILKLFVEREKWKR